MSTQGKSAQDQLVTALRDLLDLHYDATGDKPASRRPGENVTAWYARVEAQARAALAAAKGEA